MPSGNMGNLLWIIIPAICEEDGNPFGNDKMSSARGLASFSMAVEPQISSVSALNAVLVEVSDVFVLFVQIGGIYIWTHSYSLMRNSSKIYHASHGGVIEKKHGNDQRVSTDQENMLSLPVEAVEEIVENQIVS
ncbi:hypothetical protein BHE74_00022985 [Ensete ventricosum]|nr:hypothetical protein GW17_00044407 [Ensete ventricosum]RWW69416.1 hypothetical protein BHE74_00022985 [Ensete ventricosum]RZS01721.1 hypothetical protein BHM03_00031633 [Ensete ventricosum]